MDWAEKINLSAGTRLEVPGSQLVLCGININNQSSAFGLKDGSIAVMSNDGKVVTTLKEHKASICSLALVKVKGQTYLASGSDIGCSKIIIWDTNTWQPL